MIGITMAMRGETTGILPPVRGGSITGMREPTLRLLSAARAPTAMTMTWGETIASLPTASSKLAI